MVERLQSLYIIGYSVQTETSIRQIIDFSLPYDTKNWKIRRYQSGCEKVIEHNKYFLLSSERLKHNMENWKSAYRKVEVRQWFYTSREVSSFFLQAISGLGGVLMSPSASRIVFPSTSMWDTNTISSKLVGCLRSNNPRLALIKWLPICIRSYIWTQVLKSTSNGSATSERRRMKTTMFRSCRISPRRRKDAVGR